jgi:hypothetical protein
MLWRRMGEWRYSSTILDLGTRWRLIVSFMTRPFYLQGNTPPPPVPIGQENGWDLEPGWTLCGKENLAPVEIGTLAIQPVVRRYTDWVIPAAILLVMQQYLFCREWLSNRISIFFYYSVNSSSLLIDGLLDIVLWYDRLHIFISLLK